MKAPAPRIMIDRVDRGPVMVPTKGGILVDGWREEFSCQVDGRMLVARVEVIKREGMDVDRTRMLEALKTLEEMAKEVARATGLFAKVEIGTTADGQSVIYFELSEPEVPKLKGVELIQVRGLLHLIHNQNPKWPRDKVNLVLARARLGKGPYAGEWARMTARGPRKGPDEDDASSPD